ncbi:unnamed protein product [Withania somnifera]
MLPVKLFLDRFKPCKPTRDVTSIGISPTKLLLERSMLFTIPMRLLIHFGMVPDILF